MRPAAHKNIFDISVTLDEATVIYPGDTFCPLT